MLQWFKHYWSSPGVSNLFYTTDRLYFENILVDRLEWGGVYLLYNKISVVQRIILWFLSHGSDDFSDKQEKNYLKHREWECREGFIDIILCVCISNARRRERRIISVFSLCLKLVSVCVRLCAAAVHTENSAWATKRVLFCFFLCFKNT